MVNLILEISYYAKHVMPILWVIVFLLFIFFLYWLIVSTLWEIEYNFLTLYDRTPIKNFKNPVEKSSLNISLYYKIYSVPLTIYKVLFYFILVIASFFTLRLIRLGKIIDVTMILYKGFYLSIGLKLLFCIGALLYLYLLKTYIKIFSSLLYFELKRLYIFLLQIGSSRDIDNYKKNVHKRSYFERWIEKPLTLPAKTMFRLYATYKNYHHLTLNDIKQLLLDDKYDLWLPMIYVPLFYLIQKSKYRKSFIVKKLIKLLKKIVDNRWDLCYSMPVLILLYSFLYEYYMKNGLVSNIYNILLLVFLYKIYLDCIYFFDVGTCSLRNETLCIYYYVIQKMHLKVNAEAAIDILVHYTVFTTKQEEYEWSVYLQNHLDLQKICEIAQGDEYKHNLKWHIIQKLIQSKLLQLFIALFSTFKAFFYHPKDLIKSLALFKNNYNILDNITHTMVKPWLIIIITLISWHYLFILSLLHSCLLSLPIAFIYMDVILKNMHKRVLFSKILFLSYIILFITVLFCYMKHFNVLFMDEIFFESNIKVIQYFSLNEKISFFKEYLNYLVYCKEPYMTSLEKRHLLLCIDFTYIESLLSKDITLSQLKQLARDILELNEKKAIILRKTLQ